MYIIHLQAPSSSNREHILVISFTHRWPYPVPCATLGYVLRELQNKSKLDHTLINVDYDHDLASPYKKDAHAAGYLGGSKAVSPFCNGKFLDGLM